MIGLEYGIIGFLVYYGMILFALYAAGRAALSPQPLKGENSFLIPISVTLLNFIVIKSVFSQQDNHPLIFMVLGMLAALLWRVRNPVQSQPGRPSLTRIA
jgi:O-antigen ligase